MTHTGIRAFGMPLGSRGDRTTRSLKGCCDGCCGCGQAAWWARLTCHFGILRLMTRGAVRWRRAGLSRLMSRWRKNSHPGAVPAVLVRGKASGWARVCLVIRSAATKLTRPGRAQSGWRLGHEPHPRRLLPKKANCQLGSRPNAGGGRGPAFRTRG